MGRKKTCCRRYERKGKACKDCPHRSSHSLSRSPVQVLSVESLARRWLPNSPDGDTRLPGLGLRTAEAS
jgi:hypothetical protein